MPSLIGELLFEKSNLWTIPSFYPNDAPGFAANIFQNDNELVLAIRGTEANLIEALPFVGETGLQDLLSADIADIGLVGFAMRQTVSMVNYIMQLKGDDGTSVTQVELRSKTIASGIDPGISGPFIMVEGGASLLDTCYWLEQTAPVTGLGILNAESSVTVTGHSLGGHLAVMAIRLFPELFDQAITFNAPGFDPATSKELTDKFVKLFADELGINPADTFADIETHVTAIESEDSAPGDDASGVASMFTGIPVGEPLMIHTEKNSHSMDQLMDALAVHNLIATLNPELDVSELLHFYDGGSMDAGMTEETIVAALARVILNKNLNFIEVEANIISQGDFAGRVAIHNQILAIHDMVVASGLSLDSLWDKTAEQLAALAQTSMAHRYAIQNLDPFAILGDASAYLEMPGNQAILTNTHSEAYWLARAGMLLAKFSLGLTDGEVVDVGGSTITYVDIATGVEIEANVISSGVPLNTVFAGESGTGTGTISGGDEPEYIFGGAGKDRLAGGAGSDIIDGGAGDDVLYAAGASSSSDDGISDWVEGGMGADTFYVGDGDVVSDSDRSVSGILVAGQSVHASYYWVSDGLFSTADGSRTLRLAGDDALITINTLPAPATVTILDFAGPGMDLHNSDYGIYLFFPDDQSLPASTITKVDSDGYNVMAGTVGNDGMLGLEGNDLVVVLAGTDYVDAGPGNDVVYNYVPNYVLTDWDGDNFIGGPGNDFLSGHAGGDQHWGGDGEDLIQGGRGADMLSGGNGADTILGGDGDDIIYGGPGPDVIYSDKGSVRIDHVTWLASGGVNLARNWSVANSIEPTTDGAPFGDDRVWGGSGGDFLSGGVGSDSLFGGEGGDRLQGDDDADNLDGGSESDRLFGGNGEDYLQGGSGDDTLDGQQGNDIYDGGTGSDKYVVAHGKGWELIQGFDPEPDAVDAIVFDGAPSILSYNLFRAGSDLVLQNKTLDAGIVITGWFNNPDAIVDEIHFYEGAFNSTDIQTFMAGEGTRWNDVFTGGDGADRYWGASGADKVHAAGGNDVIYGESGRDELFGEAGDDALYGGDGADGLVGGPGNDKLFGGDGKDSLQGGDGDDFLSAGRDVTEASGNHLRGGEGSDTYDVYFSPGTFTYFAETDSAGDDFDVLQLHGDVQVEDMMVFRYLHGENVSNHLGIYITQAGVTAELFFDSWFSGPGARIEAIELDDGTVITAEQVVARLNTTTNGRDHLTGSGEVVILEGMAGDDVLIGKGTANELHGGDGSDQMSGHGSENILHGGDGADRLEILRALPATPDSPLPVDIIAGGNGGDVIKSSAASASGVVFMDGGKGGDALTIHGGRATVIAGGGGFDSITGELSTTDVVILLNRGDKGDVISTTNGWGVAATDPLADGASHVISFGGGIALSDISLKQDGNDLLILTGDLEGLRLQDYFDAEGNPASWVTQIQIVNQPGPSSGTGAASAEQYSPVLLLDFNPVLEEFMQQRTAPDQAWRIADGDAVQSVQYLSASAAGGQIVYEYGLLGEDVHAHLGAETVTALLDIADTSAPVAIDILETEPVPGVAIDQLQARRGDLFVYRLPEDFMVDPIFLEELPVTLDSGHPSWLSYDPVSRELSGIPGSQDVGLVTVSFTATNRFGEEASVSLTIETVQSGLVITGSSGADVLAGAEGDDTISGGDGRDRLMGDAGDDHLDGGGRDDVMSGGAGQDEMLGGTGRDTLAGDAGDDVLRGGADADQLMGGAGNDSLRGELGNDRLFGGQGDDVLFADSGNDWLRGDLGNDVYHVAAGAGKVSIADSAGDDSLEFDSFSRDDARFSRQRGNLVIRFEDTRTKVVISDWFSNPDARVESFTFSDGVTLLEQDVLRLVQHRAGFSARASGLSLAPMVPADGEFVPLTIAVDRLVKEEVSVLAQRWAA